VSIDLATARHPQALLATHYAGAPLRLVVPMKLGLKNIKAITDITYTEDEPPPTTGTSARSRSTTACERCYR
jgi:DMSO/TMAO reductase YedYZ molybdopterin-dependent catalytic subunit